MREREGEETVTGFAIDHRKVAPGTVFGAFQGTVVNGEDFIPARFRRARSQWSRGRRRDVEGARTLPIRYRAGRSLASPRSSSAGARDRGCRTGHQRQDLDRRDDPQIWRMCGQRARVDRHARRDHSPTRASRPG
jgi:UDP-N-acetylmuramoyl-L-alanyl-D-glutamate--2,6-diaminopimelate ligase